MADFIIMQTEDEGLHIVVKSKAKTTKAIKYRIRKILKAESIEADLYGEGYVTTYAFPPDYVGLYRAWKWQLK